MVVDEPIHRPDVPGTTVTVGRPFTVMERVAVLLQPAALVPVTVYVVVADGVTLTGLPVVLASPADGLQV